jgi:tRNA-2-methylthio-N6-dimethylallyladenosine synthase
MPGHRRRAYLKMERTEAAYPELSGKSYYVMTFGCQMNVSDTERMEAVLSDAGMERAARAEHADLVLLNTCSVRQKAEDRAYGNLGHLKPLHGARPGMLIGVCGCMAQREGEAILRKAPHVGLVIGTAQIHRLPELAAAAWRTGERLVATDLPAKRSLEEIEAEEDLLAGLARGRNPYKAWVPVMYGCDRFCAFCIVPMTRGAERSRRPEEIEAQVRAAAAAGRKEVTLLGQTVNSYGHKLPQGISFADLLRRLNEIEGIERIRFTSPYPMGFTDELIDAMAELPKVCEHVHLPLQSGDDEVLVAMRRGYTVAEYEAVYWALRERVPGISITTDLMVGHPGETAEQHQNSLRTVERLRFDAAFTFHFSPRPRTRAARMPDQVPHDEKMRRLAELIELQNAITMERNASHIGEVLEVLVDCPSDKEPSILAGYARNNKLIHVPGPAHLAGALCQVRITEAHIWGLAGEPA